MRRSLVLVFLLAPFAIAQEGRKGVNFYSLEQEVALGRQLAREFQRDVTALESRAASEYIDGIGRRLVARAGGPPFTYTFTLVTGDRNFVHSAAAFPGGFLFVPASLILAARDEDEFAGMLAQAIAHVAARDYTRQATRAELLHAPSTSWRLAASDAQNGAIPLALLHMWRKCELDADRLAARAMSAVGYNPKALARYIDREQAPYDEHSAATFSPLPRRAQRAAVIEAVIKELPAQVYPPHEGLAKIQEEVRRSTAP